MSAVDTSQSIEKPARFPGHPFGDLRSEDRCGTSAEKADPLSASECDLRTDAMRPPDNPGFDFHLAVYAIF